MNSTSVQLSLLDPGAPPTVPPAAGSAPRSRGRLTAACPRLDRPPGSTARASAATASPRLHPAQLTLTGDTAELADFAAALPQLLDAVERAADQALRQLGTWLRDTVTGRAVAEDHDLRPLRTRWRRGFITAVARDRALGTSAPLPLPQRTARWDQLPEHFARTAAHHLDPAACADPDTAAQLIGRAVAEQPLTRLSRTNATASSAGARSSTGRSTGSTPRSATS